MCRFLVLVLRRCINFLVRRYKSEEQNKFNYSIKNKFIGIITRPVYLSFCPSYDQSIINEMKSYRNQLIGANIEMIEHRFFVYKEVGNSNDNNYFYRVLGLRYCCSLC